MDFNFKLYGTVDVSGLISKLNKLDWDAYTFRQDTHKVHKATKTIPLIFDESLKSMKIHAAFGIFIPDLEKVKTILNEQIGKGVMQSAIFINLPAGQEVARHVDKADNFKLYHRIHIPIQTNAECLFEVDGEIINMKEGEIWEINNDEKYHSVWNKGAKDRIHLLIDWMVKGQF